MIKNCPEPVDVQDIQFKLHCKLKIFNNKDVESFHTPYNLISCASRYGLLFIGDVTRNLQVIQLSCCENYTPKDKEISNYPRRYVSLPSNPKHISVNCDSTILAVVLDKERCPAVFFYDVLSFLKESISILKEVRLSANPTVHVTEVNWNPSLPAVFTACKSDGTLGVYEIKDNSVDINELPTAAEATTFCWSPKGKQIAVGSKSGKITQYKPDLKAVKVINAPPLEGVQYLISLQWVSNYQFIGIFQPSDLASRAKLIVIDAPKSGETTFIDYEDVCYSGAGRPPQFFMNFQQQWNILMVASSNSTEVAVLGLNPPETWVQWNISDSARAELPLSSDRQETFPVGMTFDTSNIKPFPWGESSIPPCPFLIILSHQGLLCVFNVINLKNMPNLCSPPDAIKDFSGLKFFVTEAPSTNTTPKTAATVLPSGQPKPVVTIFQSEQPKSTETNFQSEHSKPPQLKSMEQNKPSAFATTPPSTMFSVSQKTASSTPITEANQSRVSSALSQNLFGGQVTVTPIKPQSAPKSTDKYASIFSALNTPAAAAVPIQAKLPVPVAPEQIKNISSDLNVQTKLNTAESIIKTDLEENLLGKVIKEECISLDSELKAMIHKGRTITVNIGYEEEKLEMSERIRTLEGFLKEIVDISMGENAEIHTLKQNLVLSWAWYEEALSHYNSIKNEKMNFVLKSRPLDTVTDKRSTEIKKLIYYIESQLLQVSKELDEQWDNFQTNIKKTQKMQMPTMETIFQTMVRQCAVLQRQDYIMKDIRQRLKHKVTLHGSKLLIPKDTQGNLEEAISRLDIDSDNNREMIKKLDKQFLTKTKTKKLRNLLRNHKVTHITAIKPPLSQTSPLSKHIIEAKLSSTTKPSAKKLTFSRSLPTKEQQYSIIHVDPFKNISTESTDIKPPSPLPSSKPTSMFSNLPSAFAQTGTNLFNKTDKSITPVSTSTVPKTQKPVSTGQMSVQPSTAFKSPQFNFGNNLSKTPVKSPEVTLKESTANAATSGGTSKPVFTFGGLTQTKTPLSPKSSNNEVLTSTTFSFASSNKPTFTLTSGNLFENLASSKSPSVSVTSSTLPQSTASLPLKAGNYATLDKKPTATSSNTEQPKPLLFGPSVFSVPSNTANIFSPSSSNLLSVVSSRSDSTSKNFSSSDIPSGVDTNFKVNTISPSSLPTNVSIFSSSPALTTTNSVSIFGSNTSSPSLSITSTTSRVSSVPPSMLFGSKMATITEASELEITKIVSTSPIIASSISKPASATSSISNNNLTEAAKSTNSNISSSSSIFSTSTKPFGVQTTESSNAKLSFIEPQQGSTFTSSTIQGSIFAAQTTTTTASITTSQTSIFSSSPSSTMAKSIFGSSDSNAAIFSFSSGTTDTAPLVTQSAVFNNSKSTDSVFGTVTSTSIFGQSTAFDTNAVTTASIFSTSVASTSTTSIFGTKTSETATNIFGNKSPESTSIFGTEGTAKSSGVFGTNTTSTSSFFGTSTPTTTSNIFGSNSPTTTSSSFGTSTTANIFGANTPTSSNIFGASSPTTSNIFGGTSNTPTSNIFGSKSPAATTASSVFGGNTSGSIFGSGGTTTAATGIFGSSSVVTTQSVFGTNPPTTAMSIFGGSNLPNSSNVFKTDSSSNIFGSPPSGAQNEGSFNFGNLNVGNTTTSSNIFGSNTTTVNPFDRPTEQKSTFGGGSIFGTPSSTTTSVFGTTPTTSIFGSNQSSTFGTNTQQSAFGNSSFGANPNTTFNQSASFGQNSYGNTAFSSPQPGPFSSGGSGVGQSGFGSPSAFQKQSGFGAAPVFGGSPTPAFGGSPSFGSAATFGSGPTFGSPSKVFGSNPTTGFGSSTSSPGFGNLATQNTIGFGNLAQQASTSTSAPFSGSSSFSNWR